VTGACETVDEKVAKKKATKKKAKKKQARAASAALEKPDTGRS
jgi:hypothetical protein